MMRPSRGKLHRAALSAAMLLCLAAASFLSGCSILDRFASTAAPPPSPPASQSAPQTPQSTATPFSINPLYSFYHAYLSDTRNPCNALAAALVESDASAVALQFSLELSLHRAALSDIGATVCRLFPGDDGLTYSGTVQGAASGTGSMRASGDSSYSYTFTYDDGDALAGEYETDVSARFSLGAYAPTPSPTQTPTLTASGTPEPETAPQFNARRTCSIEKTAEGWTSTVEEDGFVSILTLGADKIEFARNGIIARLAGGELTFELAVTEATATPEQ